MDINVNVIFLLFSKFPLLAELGFIVKAIFKFSGMKPSKTMVDKCVKDINSVIDKVSTFLRRNRELINYLNI